MPQGNKRGESNIYHHTIFEYQIFYFSNLNLVKELGAKFSRFFFEILFAKFDRT